LCDSGEKANLMSLTKARELGNLKIFPFSHSIEYANGHEEKAIGILNKFTLNIGGFDYCLDILIADTRGRYEFL
jgi:hypothetical protein